MKAIQIDRFGGPEVMKLVEGPDLIPGPGQVLVRVAATGINFADTLMRQNRYAFTPPLPAILGNEVTGTIEAVGEQVHGLEIGARVAAPLFAAGEFCGGYATSVLINADFVVAIPQSLSFETAAALLVQGLTALHLTLQSPPRGKVVLVNAAAGGVGSLLIQLAKRAGAKRVLAAASSSGKLDFARELGADATINYTQPDWVAQVKAASGGNSPDIIYESAGGAVTKGSLEALAPLGELVIYGALNIQEFQLGIPELLGLIFKNQSVTGFALTPLLTPRSLRAGLAELFDLVATSQLRVSICETYPFERVADAHRALEGRKTTGKLILKP